jgi:hypothetical protein
MAPRILKMASYGGERLASRTGRFSPEKSFYVPVGQGVVWPYNGYGHCDEEKTLAPLGIKPRLSSPWPSHYTD